MATRAEQLEREKKKRTAIRQSTTKLLTKLEKELQKAEVDGTVLNITLTQLTEKEATLFKIDKDIEDLTEDLEALEAEISNQEDYREKITEGRVRAEQWLKKDRESEASSVLSDASSKKSTRQAPAAQVTVRLPQLLIDKFNGDACEWQNFWAKFAAAIDENESLTDVDKFSYLKAYLEGNALASITGLSLNSENYEKAISILKQRFGRKDTLVNAHMNRLLSLTPVRRSHDLAALRRLYDECEVQIRSLETMGMASDSYGSLLCPLIFKLIPEELTLEFNRQRADDEDILVEELLTFIRKEVESRERTQTLTRKTDNEFKSERPIVNTQRESYNSRWSGQRSNQSNRTEMMNKKGPKPASAASLNTIVEENCVFCERDDHKSDDCTRHTVPEKKEILKNRGRCYVCYRKRHMAKNCRSSIVCPLCQRRHRKGLCWQLQTGQPKEADTIVAAMVPKETPVDLSKSVILLQTVRAIAVGPGTGMEVRCLLDGGSQRTFIREDLAKMLKLPLIDEEDLSLHTFGRETPLSTKLKRVRLTLHHKADTSRALEIEALAIPEICTAVIQVPNTDLQQQVRRLGIELSDQPGNGSSDCSISVLIGTDLYWKITTGNLERLTSNLVALDTVFGWSLQGATVSSNLMTTGNSVGIMQALIAEEDPEDLAASMALKKFWDIESLGVVDRPEHVATDKEIMQSFENTIAFKEGRYEVRLPWKDQSEGWPDNFAIAEKRLRGLVRRFQHKPVLYNQYKEIIEDHLEKGIAEEVPEEYLDESRKRAVFYLPHQAVIRPEKTTTKVRIVFDASAHGQNSPSLNDLLHAGPNLNPDLLNLLIRFRMNNIAFVADIEKAFLQIGLNDEDRDAVRFLWINGAPNDQASLKELRMTRVLFGVKSSPYLLAAVIKHHVAHYEEQYPEASQGLMTSLYVDDLIHGAADEEDAYLISSESKDILNEGNFMLRKWQTNSNSLKERWRCNGFDVDHPETVMKDQPQHHKVLGLLWNAQTDVFNFEADSLRKFISDRKPTKRLILQAAGRVFDPLGFLAPFTIRMKVLFQQLWERGLQWDQELPEEIRIQWDDWCKELSSLYKVSVTRHCFAFRDDQSDTEVQIHCFTDASETAYGAVVYVRYYTKEREQQVSFIAAKTRVAPLKKLSIPRLELMGALIGARLVDHLSKAFIANQIIFQSQFWTDSLITLCWIQSDSGRWKPFVSNRVQEIQDKSEPAAWRHCPGSDNPADALTRGKSVTALIESQNCWCGPSWLSQDERDWPTTAPNNNALNDLDPEKRGNKKNVTQGLLTEEAIRTPLLDLNKYSKLSRALRVTAWVLRFVNNVGKLNDSKTGPLEAREIQDAEKYWIGETQRQSFGKEVEV